MAQTTAQRLRYFVWAATRSVLDRDSRCPACNSSDTRLLRRKYLVTSLRECDSCGLRFRMPKDEVSDAKNFYQRDYSAGFTTDCPSETLLSSLIETKFSGCERDYKIYIDILKALGLRDGDSLLEFGCSWGYGSWQFRQAGFRVFSYEISKPRADFARTRLSCTVLESIDKMPERVKCLFSAHVIEHLPNPNLIWEVASKVLTKDGIIVCFCPNGAPARESLIGASAYDGEWGKVHPMFITPKYLQSIHSGFRSYVCCSPYTINEM